MKTIKINTEYITLGQLLKLVGEISQGSDVKIFLKSQKIMVNNEEENRRGKKLRPHDEVVVADRVYVIE
ncbi:MAG: S4 domain-containing protein YaaA [Bacilli bacterium]